MACLIIRECKFLIITYRIFLSLDHVVDHKGRNFKVSIMKLLSDYKAIILASQNISVLFLITILFYLLFPKLLLFAMPVLSRRKRKFDNNVEISTRYLDGWGQLTKTPSLIKYVLFQSYSVSDLCHSEYFYSKPSFYHYPPYLELLTCKLVTFLYCTTKFSL